MLYSYGRRRPQHLASIVLPALLCFAGYVKGSTEQGPWSIFAGPDGDFTISFPRAPSHEVRITPQKPFTGQRSELFTYNSGGRYFFLVYVDLPTKAGPVDEQSILTEYERGLFVNGWLVSGRTKLSDGGFQYEAVMNLPGGGLGERPQARLRSRVYVRGRRAYTLSVSSPAPDWPAEDSEHFFSSLRFLKPPPAPLAPRRQVFTSEEASAARAALRVLRRLAAAESVFPSYEDYVRLLLGVKGEVDGYLAELPPGEVRDEIALALEAYQDFRRAWDTTRGLLAAPVIGYEPQRTLIVKYGIPIDRRGDMPVMDFNGAVVSIFGAARGHIDRASALFAR